MLLALWVLWECRRLPLGSWREPGQAASICSTISGEMVEHDTTVYTLPSKECAMARSLIASAMS